PVSAVRQREDGRFEGEPAGAAQDYAAVISTSAPQLLRRLAPDLPPGYTAQLDALQQLGPVAVLLALDQQLLTDGTYWLSLPADHPDKSRSEFPFLALVEHTNYMDRAHYGGDHLVYCGDYVPPDHEYFDLSEDELVERFISVLHTFNPTFSPERD